MITVVQPHRSKGGHPWPYSSRPSQDFIAVRYRGVPWMLLFLFLHSCLFKGFLLWVLGWKSFLLWLTLSPLLLFLHQALFFSACHVVYPIRGTGHPWWCWQQKQESPQTSFLHSIECLAKTSLGSSLYSGLKGVWLRLGKLGRGRWPPPVAWCWMLQHFLRTYSGFATVLVSCIRQWQDKWDKGSPRSVTTTLLEENAFKV